MSDVSSALGSGLMPRVAFSTAASRSSRTESPEARAAATVASNCTRAIVSSHRTATFDTPETHSLRSEMAAGLQDVPQVLRLLLVDVAEDALGQGFGETEDRCIGARSSWDMLARNSARADCVATV